MWIFHLGCLVMSEDLEIWWVRKLDFSAFQLILEYFVTIKVFKICHKKLKEFRAIFRDWPKI